MYRYELCAFKFQTPGGGVDFRTEFQDKISGCSRGEFQKHGHLCISDVQELGFGVYGLRI